MKKTSNLLCFIPAKLTAYNKNLEKQTIKLLLKSPKIKQFQNFQYLKYYSLIKIIKF